MVVKVKIVVFWQWHLGVLKVVTNASVDPAISVSKR
jgi:hypothetical protein